MDLFVIDNTGESELLNKNEQYNAITTTTIQPLDDKSPPSIAATITSSTCNIISAPLIDDDEDDPIDGDDEYTGDLPINSIDIAQFITLPEPKPKDPVTQRIEQYCFDLKRQNEDEFIGRLTHTDVDKEMKQCITAAIDRKTLEDLSLKKKQKRKKVKTHFPLIYRSKSQSKMAK